MSKFRLAGLIATLLLLCAAAVSAQDLAVGFQITDQFKGFSFKYPMAPGQIIQPIINLSASDTANSNDMKGTFAVRVLYDRGVKGSYRGYFGWGVGMETVKTTKNSIIVKNETNYGVQGFVGLETARPGAAISTSVELTLGMLEDGSSSGGGYKAGFGLGLGLHYYF